MDKKSFLLNLEPEKLNSIDTYCKAIGIPRVRLFEELAEKRLSENKKNIKGILDYHSSYIDSYKKTIMYDEGMSHLIKPKTKDCISFQERESLKQIGNSIAETGETEMAMFLIDVAHRQRDIESKSGKGDSPLSLYEYIDRKYNNHDLATY